ncbi:hypothetical protein IQ272_19545 [Chroococcidiopsidales cyanobacterium LEGE 13417]|nr:hypothetical protein [Chroococcidiopsidales cyanobacterium LEGE 13417]
MSSTLYTHHDRQRKRWHWAATATAALLLAASPSSSSLAQNFVDNSGSLDEAIGSIESTVLNLLGLARWQAQLNDLLNDPCRDLPVVFITTPEPGWCLASSGGASSISDILSDSTGAIGIPNPNTARQEIEKGIQQDDTAPDAFEINAQVYAVQAGNLSDRVVTRQAIESLLGEKGQEQLARELEGAEEIAAGNEQRAEEAQDLDVTQDIMKLFIQNEAQTSAIAAGIRADLARLRVDTQFTNLNLTNISRTLDESARHERVEQAALSAKILSLSAQAGLMGQ